MKTRQMGAIPPSAILSRKGIARYGGVISHLAAKVVFSGVEERAILGIERDKRFLACSFCHLDFVKEFPHFGRKISAKIT